MNNVIKKNKKQRVGTRKKKGQEEKEDVQKQ